MASTGIVLLLIIVGTTFFSYKGFKSHAFFEKYEFEVEKVRLYKDYKRLLTSGFLHINWLHLIFNMLTLLLLSGSLQAYLGTAH